MISPKIAVINCGSKHIQNIYDILLRYNCITNEVLLENSSLFPFHMVNAIIISGGPHLFTDPITQDTLSKHFSFINQLNLPILGICLGHQALGISHGVMAYKGTTRCSKELIKIEKSHALLKDISASAIFQADHCEGIPLPNGFELLGSSEYYPVEIMAHIIKPFYGVQFHPEISGENGNILIKNFIELINQ